VINAGIGSDENDKDPRKIIIVKGVIYVGIVKHNNEEHP
jgi:hypothetical protein